MYDPRIDQYINNSQLFAQPVMIKLRELIHKGCPEITETIKWGMPSFDYMGPLCGFASFKNHCTFGFWKTALIKDPENYLQESSAQGGTAMGNLGRMTSVKDLPPARIMIDFIKQAMKLNADGVKIAKKPAVSKKNIPVPEELKQALKKNAKATFYFEKFSSSQQKEYNEWIADARTDTTRNRRIELAIEWISEGKIRN